MQQLTETLDTDVFILTSIIFFDLIQELSFRMEATCKSNVYI